MAVDVYGPWVLVGLITAVLAVWAGTRNTNVVMLGGVTATATSGLAIGGWTFVDELLLIAIIAGAVVTPHWAALTRRREWTDTQRTRVSRAHQLVFTTLCVYLVVQGIRGIVELAFGDLGGGTVEALRKVRWPVMYIVVLIFARLSWRGMGEAHRPLEWPTNVATAGLWYMLAYLGIGVVSEQVFGVGRFSLQPGMAAYSGENLGGFSIFGSTAYAMFPAVAVVPASLILMASPRRPRAILGAATLAVVATASVYYDSRVTLLFLAGIVPISLLSARARGRGMAAAAVLAVVVATATVARPQEAAGLLADLRTSGGAFWAEEGTSAARRDFDRLTHIRAGLEASNESWPVLLVGHGYRMSSFVVGTYYYDLYSLERTAGDWNLDNFATEAFTALLLDGGWLAIGLVVLSGLLTAREIRRTVEIEHRWILVFALFAAIGWMLVINMLDILLFYFVLMPGGLLVKLGSASSQGDRGYGSPTSRHQVVPSRHLFRDRQSARGNLYAVDGAAAPCASG